MRRHFALAITQLAASLIAASLVAACNDVTAPDKTLRVARASRTAECCPGLRLCLCQGRTARAPQSGFNAASGFSRTSSQALGQVRDMAPAVPPLSGAVSTPFGAIGMTGVSAAASQGAGAGSQLAQSGGGATPVYMTNLEASSHAAPVVTLRKSTGTAELTGTAY